MWSVETFSRLQQDETANPGWRQVGSLRVALTQERVREFERLARVAEQAGLEVCTIDRRAAGEKWPAMDFRHARAALWCPTDGYLQPSDLTMAYVAHARAAGIRFQTSTTVQDILVENGHVAAVVTDRGTVRCGRVINAAGAHAWHVARLVGLDLPIVPVRHEFFVTVDAAGLRPELPVVRIPDASLYLRAEVNSLLVGGWETPGTSLVPADFPLSADPPRVREDWDVLAHFGKQLAPHLPQVDELGIRSVFKGWPTFTPDGRFIIGPSRRVGGFVMAGGCNAHGVSGSAGIGRHVVESILEPEPSPYVQSLSPDRFTESTWDWPTATRDARRVYETYYALED